MAKTLTANAKAKAKTQLGTEPLLILKIQWESGTKYYSTKEYTFDGNVCEVGILEHINVETDGKQGSIGEIGSIDIVLDDTDGDLKNRINTDIIEGTRATAYHHYDDLTASDAIVELSGRIAGPIAWSEGERTLSFSIESLSGTGTGAVGFAPEEDTIENMLEEAENIPWPICFGNPRFVKPIMVQRLEQSEIWQDKNPDEQIYYNLIYIVNLVQSSDVTSIFAQRNCYGDGGYFLVPSAYYTVNTAYSYGGKTVTAILMTVPLSARDNSGWSDEIFCNVESTLSANPVTQIKWILDTYSTNLTTDASSFSAVAAKVAPIWAHWALFDQPDALKLAEEMAWMARCALFVKDDIVYIKFLAETPVTISEINKDITELKTMELGFTDTEDIVTNLKAIYVSDYSGTPEAAKELTYTNNTDKFGVEEEEIDFFIYTNPICVKVAATFWGYRYSNSWRQIEVTSFLPNIGVESYDWVNIDISQFSSYALPALVRSTKHDTGEHRIQITAEIASSAGTSTGGQPSLDAGYYNAGNNLVPGSVGTPVASVDIIDTCVEGVDEDTIREIIRDSGSDKECMNCRVLFGDDSGYAAHEIVGMEREYHTGENILLLDIPSKNNLPPDKVAFTNPDSILVGRGGLGCCFSASSPQWVDYERNPVENPGYFSDQQTRVDDRVGTVKGRNRLSKGYTGFKCVGVDGSEIAVVNDQVDASMEKIVAGEPIKKWVPYKDSGQRQNGAKVIVTAEEDNTPPGQIMFSVTDLSTGEEGLGYNAFDATGYAEGDVPSEIGVEVGVVGGTNSIQEGGTGFIYLGRQGDKNLIRPT